MTGTTVFILQLSAGCILICFQDTHAEFAKSVTLAQSIIENDKNQYRTQAASTQFFGAITRNERPNHLIHTVYLCVYIFRIMLALIHH